MDALGPFLEILIGGLLSGVLYSLVALGFVLLTGFQLGYHDWRGAIIGWLAIVWIANQYMSIYNRIRVDIRTQRSSALMKERALQEPEHSHR